jgi:hypothetical protein
MTNEEIVKLAKEAGFWGVDEWFKAALPRFSEMIDKAQEIERDACLAAVRGVMLTDHAFNTWKRCIKAIESRARGNKGKSG